MKKALALLLCLLFGGSMMVMSGCAPKQEAENQAPAVEEAAPAAVDSPMNVTPGVAPAAGEQAPAEE